MKQRAIVSVTNDLATDQRVSRTCNTLQEVGFDVLLVGRKLPESLPINRNYKTKRFRLLFRKKSIFYAEYNLRLFFYLLFKKHDLLIANDLDTLLPNFLISKLTKTPLIYDSHEYYCGVPELINRPKTQKFWRTIEKFCFPKLKDVITVNQSIADIYKQEYGIDLYVVRNIPSKKHITNLASKRELKIPENQNILILQGSGINIDRGTEELVEAMLLVKNAVLLIIGGGDVIPKLKQMVKNKKLSDKIQFIDKQVFEKLYNYTVYADLGLTLDKDTNINYRFSLPNKLFDYIHAGVPVLASDLIEIKKIILQFQVGEILPSHNPAEMAKKINEMLENKEQLAVYKKNTKKASEELCWENESKTLKNIFSQYLK